MSMPQVEDESFNAVLEESELSPAIRKFFLQLDKELSKADNFFCSKLQECQNLLRNLREQVSIVQRQEDNPPPSREGSEEDLLPHNQVLKRFASTAVKLVRKQNRMRPSVNPQRATTDDDSNDVEFGRDDSSPDSSGLDNVVAVSKRPRERLRKAMLEYYRLLELLKNFRIMNNTAVIKIMKKFDKTVSMYGMSIFETRATATAIFDEERGKKGVDDLLHATEELYASTFESGNRHTAMRQLRVPDPNEVHHEFTSWRTGLMIGLSIPVIYLSLRAAFTNRASVDDQLILQIYAGYSVPILFLFYASLLLIIWEKYHVNWVLVFELDPRDFLPPEAFSELASVLLFLFRIVASGFFPVQFRDFFITDLVSSMTYTFTSLAVLECATRNRFEDLADNCRIDKSWVVPALTAIPAYLRLAQCIRRYYDDRLVHPHLTNAMKYFLTLSVIFLSAASRILDSVAWRVVWIATALIASSYATCWDVYFDWGLLRKNKEHLYLRKVLVYPAWTYYAAMPLNFILRLSWVFLLSPNNWGLVQDSRILVYFQALLELFRRFVWSIFRMENEHTNNIGRYRAVTDVPLPFRINIVPQSSLELEETGSIRSRRGRHSRGRSVAKE
ncbi:hypothetical protein HK097_004041 [Rhizophlyctis rosea]|uniref:Uncharacterized protein n=1 Tax=Rhizophlyctis rosea TaxID=64517 RepID=A0AAD5XAH7_9FUNG|nr:hypothetical protein HK097_004041 [Rhizophlyctis rosea]